MVKIKYKGKAGYEPQYRTIHSVGADLVVQEPVAIEPVSFEYVATGVWLEVDDWCSNITEIQVRPRSSLCKKHPGLIVELGTVDLDYKEEIMIIVRNMSQELVFLNEGESIAQLVQSPIYRIGGIKMLGLKRKGGFGSTDLALLEYHPDGVKESK